jgi:hypothetical protein
MPSLAQFEAALMACMKKEPPKDHCLSRDASKLTDVYAEMAHLHEAERDLDALTPPQREAYERWKTNE